MYGTVKNSKKKKNNNTLLATACVVLGLLVIFIIFLVKRDQIKTNLKETAFFEKVFGATPQFVENHEPEAPKQDEVPLKEDDTIRIESVLPVTPKAEEEEKQIVVEPVKEETKSSRLKNQEKRAVKLLMTRKRNQRRAVIQN